MPEHVFTVVSQGLALDAQSNRLTLYALIEEIGTPGLPVAVPEINIVTLWKRQPDEEGVSFSQRVRVVGPDDSVVAEYETPFTMEKPRHRTLGRIQMALFEKTGEYRIEVSLRKQGDDQNLSTLLASYPIEVSLRQEKPTPHLFTGAVKNPQ